MREKGQTRLQTVSRCRYGLWVARDHDGSENVSQTRKDAVRSALTAGGHDNVVCLVNQPPTPSPLTPV